MEDMELYVTNNDELDSSLDTEDKAEKFKRIANKRVPAAIKSIRLIGNLSNRHSYGYEAEQVDKIIARLEQEVQALKSKFEPAQSEDDISFSLD